MAARGPGTGAWPVRALGPAVQALMTGRHEPDESRDSRPDLWGAAAEMPPPTRQDSNRRRDFDCTSFTFLGYEFRPRESRSGKSGSIFTSFQPAISPVALKDKSQQIRRWRIHLRTTRNLEELAEWINPVVRGWMNYYGRSTAPSCSSSHGASTITWPGGPCASSSDSKASTPRPWPGCRRSTCMRQTCSPTGNSSHSLPGGLWGPDDGRLSRPVLRAAGGAIPPADSPRCRLCCG